MFLVHTMIEGLDELRTFVSSMPKHSERARNSALAAVGFEFKKQAKDNAKNNVFNWPQLSRATPHIRKHPETAKPTLMYYQIPFRRLKLIHLLPPILS